VCNSFSNHATIVVLNSYIVIRAITEHVLFQPRPENRIPHSGFGSSTVSLATAHNVSGWAFFRVLPIAPKTKLQSFLSEILSCKIEYFIGKSLASIIFQYFIKNNRYVKRFYKKRACHDLFEMFFIVSDCLSIRRKSLKKTRENPIMTSVIPKNIHLCHR